MAGCSAHPAVRFVQSASPAELAWETVGGVGYIPPSMAPRLVPATARTASCAEWRHRGYHLVAQVRTVTLSQCQNRLMRSQAVTDTAASGKPDSDTATWVKPDSDRKNIKKTRKDYTFGHQFDEKPGTYQVAQARQ